MKELVDWVNAKAFIRSLQHPRERQASLRETALEDVMVCKRICDYTHRLFASNNAALVDRLGLEEIQVSIYVDQG